jgi:alkylglycerol monooxygenase
MGPNYIALAVPFFFLLIGIELAVARQRKRQPYRFADTIADLGCGVTQRVVLLFFEALLLLAYVVLYQKLRLVDLGRYPLAAWLVAFLGVDFIYYWWHRASHRVNFLWAAHVVHHQSEEFNLAVALRQGVLTPLTITPFALPLALLGIPPLIYIVVASFSTLYQFWIHTELIGRLGPLEKVLNTPSHHRVHHARNPGYLDRNYGAVLIVWDRLFGTYAPERERPQYGITKPLRSFNALWAQVQPLAELTVISRAAPTWRDRLSVWLAPPERSFSWHPQAPFTTGSGDPARYDVAVSAPVRRYVLVNFALAIVATFFLMLWSNSLPLPVRAASAAVVLLTVLTAGGLLERQRWARPLELLRLASVAPVFAWAWLSIG